MAHYCSDCLTSFVDQPGACPNLACGSNRPEQGWAELLAAGDVLDRNYQIERCLAVGGAGLTYLARELDAEGAPGGPQLAIKVLYAARATGSSLTRLANEAQILQELSHQHLVRLRGFVHRTGQEPYLVTLFEPGGSLAAHVERVGVLGAPVAAAILRQILLALDVAHGRDVVHRDLKPDNVLLSEVVTAQQVPYIRVADFGIAKVSGAVGGQLTRMGSFVGTPEYAAPEQFEGHTPTAATDVFAAGGLLWFLLTGTAPVQLTHRGDIESSHAEVLAQIPPALPDSLHLSDAERSVITEVLANTLTATAGARWPISRILEALQPLLALPGSAHTTFELGGLPPIPRPPSGPASITDAPLPPPRLAPPPAELPVPPAPPTARTADLVAPARPAPAVDPVAPPPTPTPIPAPRAGVGVAGCMGMSVLGVVVVAVLGLGVLGVAVGGIGWQRGWFDAPVAVDRALQARFKNAPQLPEAQRAKVERALRDEGATISRVCGASGTVRADVLVSPAGRPLFALVSENGIGPDKAKCVRAGILRQRVGSLGREGRARVSFPLAK